MLRRTNFSPIRLERRAQAAAALTRARRLTWLLVALALLPGFGLRALALRQRAAFGRIETDRALQEVQLKAVRGQRDLLRRLSPQRKRARALHDEQQRWSAALAELRDRVPQGLWLTAVDIPASAGVHTVTLRGRASNAAALGQLLTGLNHSARFADATLVESHPGQDAYRGTLEFSATASLKLIAEVQP